MTITDILSSTGHRPWQLPKGNWKYYQEWNDAIFLHYQVQVSDLKEFVPNELEIDLYNDSPWISVVAFTMEKMRPRYLPSLSWISDFDEINIRTYVKLNRKPGVYFLSIEGGKKLSCKIARGASELPYRYSQIKRTDDRYQSRNLMLNDALDIHYTIGQDVTEKSELDKWLTERYTLFQDAADSINEFEVHHVEWPMNQIDINELKVSYPRFDKLLGKHPDVIHYSRGVQVLAWGKVKNERLKRP